MNTDQATLRFSLSILICAGSLLAYSAEAANAGLNGRWIGNSQIEGRNATAKTMLTLADADSSGATLRIEDVNTCTLRNGKYSAESAGKWTLSFSEANGGEGCKRLAAGTFALRGGDDPKQLYLEANYRDGDGSPAMRRAALHRYP